MEKTKTADGKTDLVKFPDNGNGFTRYGNQDVNGDHYIQPEIAAALFGAVNEFTETYPNDKVQFGDMSNSLGERPNSTHQTHSLGRYVDFRYVTIDGTLNPVDVNSKNFDKNKSQNLIISFRNFGFNDKKSIGSFPNNNGKLLKYTFSVNGHDNHGHLQNFNFDKVKYK